MAHITHKASRHLTAMLPEWTLVAFSGHRALADPDAVTAGIAEAFRTVATYGRPLAALSSAASGADTLWLQVARDLSIPATVILPFAREFFREDFTDAEWGVTSALLDDAMLVEVLDHTETRTEAYLEVGIRSVDRADVLVAVWNGAEARGEGGTAEVVEYARVTGKPIVIINPATGGLTLERLDLLRSTAGTPSGRSAAPSADSHASTAAGTAAATGAPVGASGAPGGAAGATAGTPGTPVAPIDQVRETFLALDAAANKEQPRARQVFVRIILLHLGAGILAILPLVLFRTVGAERVLALVEVIFLVAALQLAVGHRRAHHQWIANRVGAELCRSFLALWHLHRPGVRLPTAHAQELAGLRRSLAMAWHLDRTRVEDLGDARDSYLVNRIRDQLGYFTRQLAYVEPRYRRLRSFAITAMILAIVASVAGLGFSFLHEAEQATRLLKLISVVLPLVNAGVISYVVSADYGRRAVRYREMIGILTHVEQRLQHVRTWLGLTTLAADTEERLLHEVVEWHSVSLFSSEGH